MNWEASLPLLVGAVDETGDWDDVVARAARVSRRTRRRRLVLAVTALLAVAVLASPAFGVGSWYGAFFGRAASGPLVVQRGADGHCRFERNNHPVVMIRCAGTELAPSAMRPISDFSVYRRVSSGRRVVVLAGAAGPEVASVALLTAAGDLVAATPVEGGFYARMSGLPRGQVAAVVALDASGKPIACDPAAVRGCPAHASMPNKGG
jgi:hypothetical protein